MKKNARILSLLLSVAMVFGLMIVPAAAETPATVTVAAAAADVKAGDTVILEVTLTNNPGVAGAQGTVKYDEANFELVGLKADATNPMSFNGAAAPAFTLDSAFAVAGNVVLFTVELKAKSDVAAADVDVNIVDAVFVNEAGEEIDVEFIGSKVTTEGDDSTGSTGGADADDKEEPGDTTTGGATGSTGSTGGAGSGDGEVEDSTEAPVLCATEVEVALVEGEPEAALKEAAGENAAFYNVTLTVTECKAGVEDDSEEDSEITTGGATGSTGGANAGDDEAVEDTTTGTTGSTGSTGGANAGDDAVEDTTTGTTGSTGSTGGADAGDEEAGDTDVDHTNCVTRPATEDEVAAYIEENGGIEVSIDLPEGVSEETHTIKVLALVDGEVVEIEAAIADGKITFTLDGLYPVAICWTEIVVEEEVEEECQMIMPRLLPVTVEVEEGAKVNTSAKFAIAYGARRTIKITVEEGYEVADIIVNGKSVGAAETYTLKGVTKAQNIVIKTVAVAEEVAE